MSKKSYKQMQNRLYREIKRRIIAENKLKDASPKIAMRVRNIETFRIRKAINNREIQYFGDAAINGIKKEMAYGIADSLLENGCIVFMNHEQNGYDLLRDVTEIQARLDVVRPEERY